jgi:hypothetical protein
MPYTLFRRCSQALPLGVLIVLLVACSPAYQAAPPPAVQAVISFASFADEYFAALFTFRPSQATEQGFHEYDAELDDLSASSVQLRMDTLKRLQARLDTLKAGPLSLDDRIDAAMIDGAIRSELLDLETLQTWRRNPMWYVAPLGNAIDGLMKRNFAPPAARLRSVIARLRGVPALLEAMRANVDNPPREFTDLAIRMVSGSIGFFRGSVTRWAERAAGADTTLLGEFTAANDAAVTTLESADAWLKNNLLPRSKGSYAIGAKAFVDKLLYDEMVDIPLDRLLAIGEANLRKDHEALLAVARQVDPARTPAEVIASLADDHPTAADLIPFVEGALEAARQFLIDRRIVTIPSEVRPIIEETPPYLRSHGFAMMDTPGAFESTATEAFYYVTPPERDWDTRHSEEHLRLFNRPALDLLNVHEAFPGHFLQFLYSRQFPTKTRKLLGAATNVEGWAHYSEQMMVEEGFRGGDLKLRLAQLSDALIRDCRYVVGIKLHTQGMSIEDGAKCFMEQAFQEASNAYAESRRGAYDSTYLYYTLGKLKIYELRAEYKRVMGAAYSFQGFHDVFMKQGPLPLKLLRQILLPGYTTPAL